MELIIFGYSNSAIELAGLLREKGRAFKIITYKEENTKRAKEAGFEVYELDLIHKDDFLKVGIGKNVKTLFCMDDSSTKNIFVTLNARNLDPSLSIISLIQSQNEEIKMKLAGANYCVDPYDLGAHRIYRLIKKPRVFDLLDSMIFKNLDYKIDEVKVPKNSSLIGVEFHKLRIEKDYDLLLIGVESAGKFYYNTHKVYHKIREGDIFVVSGKQKSIDNFLKGVKV